MRTVIGMFASRPEAESAILRLKKYGISTDALSIAMKDSAEARDVVAATGASDMAGEGATAGAVSGAAVGTLVGLALLGSTVVLPGLGPFVIGGPLAAALTGAGLGAAGGGLLGGLIGAGLPEHEAEQYAQGLEEGRVVVAATVGDDQSLLVQRLFDEEGSMRTHLA